MIFIFLFCLEQENFFRKKNNPQATLHTQIEKDVLYYLVHA